MPGIMASYRFLRNPYKDKKNEKYLKIVHFEFIIFFYYKII